MEGIKLNIHKSLNFLFGGNSTFTVVSTKTNKRYTFKVKKGRSKDSPYFVSYLSGNDNNSDYSFLGTIFNEDTYRYSNKSQASFNSVVNKTFMWLFKTLITKNKSNFKLIEFYHEGRCGKCNRKLTDPTSIRKGFGPTCVSSVKRR